MKITGTGSALPKRIVTNDELSQIVDTSDEWIIERTGIRERRIASDETTVSLAAEAGRKALENAGVDAESIDTVSYTHLLLFTQRGCFINRNIQRETIRRTIP